MPRYELALAFIGAALIGGACAHPDADSPWVLVDYQAAVSPDSIGDAVHEDAIAGGHDMPRGATAGPIAAGYTMSGQDAIYAYNALDASTSSWADKDGGGTLSIAGTGDDYTAGVATGASDGSLGLQFPGEVATDKYYSASAITGVSDSHDFCRRVVVYVSSSSTVNSWAVSFGAATHEVTIRWDNTDVSNRVQRLLGTEYSVTAAHGLSNEHAVFHQCGRSGARNRVYVNGAAVASDTAADTGAIAGTTLAVGARYNLAGPGGPTDSRLIQFVLWGASGMFASEAAMDSAVSDDYDAVAAGWL